MNEISKNKLYKKYKNSCNNKHRALRLTMKELHNEYSKKTVDEKLYERYRSLKRQEYQIYTICPQILIGLLAGLSVGLLVTPLQDAFWIAPIWSIFFSAVAVICCAVPALLIFKTHTKILIEYEIKLIEEKIECDLKSEEMSSEKQTEETDSIPEEELSTTAN